jgi:bleomycin hydrolase
MLSSLSFAQGEEEKKNVHQFTVLHNINTTSVKNQGKTGSCWSFATQSFLETELLRKGKGEYDLSEMYIVRNLYPVKAEKYIRYHGRTNFGQGGQAHDVLMAWERFGVVPEEEYPGRKSSNEKHNHSEMVAVLKSSMDAIINTKGKITDNWKKVCNSILDIYIGENPGSFEYNGEEYTAKSFADELGIKPDDYVEITSYLRYPFYKKAVLEVPDNWTNSEYYNVPMDDMMMIINNAIKNGYSIAWDGDTSEKTFYRKKGYAVIPILNQNEDEESEKLFPEKERTISQKMREETFDNFQTTDDHLMHLIGIAENQEGTRFYYTKNSWGTKYNYHGYWYMSESFVKLKTIAIMVHKDAIPEDIKTKLGI